MAKRRKAQVDGTKKAPDSPAKDLEPRKGREIAGGDVKLDKTSPKLF